jgi:hypothetical protein
MIPTSLHRLGFALLLMSLQYEFSDMDSNVICCRSSLNDDLQLCPFCSQPFSGKVKYLVVYFMKFLKLLLSIRSSSRL